MALGCGRYFVDERALDAYATAPRAMQKRIVVDATRASDGKPARVRASEAKLEPVVDGGRRRVRVLRPMTVAGAALLAVGVAWLGAGLAVEYGMPNETSCPSEPCNLGKAALAGVFWGEAGVGVLVGGILMIVGGSTLEVPSTRGYVTLLEAVRRALDSGRDLSLARARSGWRTHLPRL